MTATTRDAFEAHWRGIQSPSKANRELNQREGNEYAHGHVARHWLTWQAATLAERERCALMCKHFGGFKDGYQCAAEIRMPPTATPQGNPK